MPALFGSRMSLANDIKRMFRAAQEGNLDVVRRFLDEGIGADIQDQHGNGAINLAARFGHAAIVRLLIDRGANINQVDRIGRTPLIACAETDNVEILEILAKSGVEINGVGEGGRTALMECANSSSVNVAKRLIELGANVNAVSDDDSSSLHEAVYCACEEYETPDENQIIPLLLASGANVDLPDKTGLTPRALAKQYSDEIDYSTLLSQSTKSK
jgi:ankyrin repeat protein